MTEPPSTPFPLRGGEWSGSTNKQGINKQGVESY